LFAGLVDFLQRRSAIDNAVSVRSVRSLGTRPMPKSRACLDRALWRIAWHPSCLIHGMSSPMPTLKSVPMPEHQGDELQAESRPLQVFEHRALQTSDQAIHLERCAVFDLIVVTTGMSVYELIVLRGEQGEVLVRGGNHFPEFCQARLVGSTAGGNALKLLTIDIGLRMEFQMAASMVVTTSAVRTLLVRRVDSAAETS
jgi:hypothetical protein